MGSVHALVRATALGLMLSVALFATRASATPVTVYADGDANYGFDPDDVAAAIALGAAAPAPVSGLFGGDGFFTVTTPDGIPGRHGKNKRRPARGISTWTLRIDPNLPDDLLPLLESFSLVILGHDPNDPMRYKTRNVGLRISTTGPWSFVTPYEGGPTYVAFDLGLLYGTLEPGAAYSIPIEYRVGQWLRLHNGEYLFPRYSIAFLSLPEPSAFALLLGAGAVGLALRRAR